jgi:phosphohistidine phosphatase
LIVVRHGEAEPKSSGTPDENRGLTDQGKISLRNNLMTAKDILRSTVDVVLSSPLLRAKESAEIARKIFGLHGFEVAESLEPEESPYEAYRTLTKYSQRECVLIVSHEPLVSRILSGLLNWNERHFAFSTSAVAMIEVKELRANPEGVLLCLLPSPAKRMS